VTAIRCIVSAVPSLGSAPLALLIAKIVLSAGFVLIGTAAAERLGPRLGGLFAATPQMAVISLIFFAIEQGPAFAAQSSFWNISGMCSTIPVLLAYLAATHLVVEPRALSIAAGVLLGAASFGLAASLYAAIPLTHATVVPLAAAVCGVTSWMVRRLPETARLRRVPTSSWLLAARAAVSALAVVMVTSLAHLLGPKWSGLMVAFPVNTLPVIVILHWHYGSDVIKPFIKRFPSGVFGVCLFNVVAFLGLERLGLAVTVTLAYAVDIAYVVLLARLSQPRPPQNALPAPLAGG
jgi:hypothetical protein